MVQSPDVRLVTETRLRPLLYNLAGSVANLDAAPLGLSRAAAGAANLPTGFGSSLVETVNTDAPAGYQRVTEIGGQRTAIRTNNGAAWTAWRVDAGNVPTILTNLATNPSVETNLTGYSTTGAYWNNPATSLTRESPGVGSGSWVGKIVADGSQNIQGANYGLAGLKPNTTYRISLSVWNVSGAGSTLAVRDTTNGVNGTIDSTQGGSGKRRLSVLLTTGATGNATATIGITARDGGGASTFYFDELTVTEGTGVVDYFDGDSAGCFWTGTPHASASARWAPSRSDVVLKSTSPIVARNELKRTSFGDGSTYGWTTAWTGAGSGQVVTVGGVKMFRSVFAAPDPTYVAYSDPSSIAGTENALASTPVTATIRFQGVAGRSYRVECYWRDQGEVERSSFSGSYAIATGQPQELTAYGTSWGGGSSHAYVIIRAADPVVGDTLFVERAQIEFGVSAFHGWADGSLPGCSWLADPFLSQSVRTVRDGGRDYDSDLRGYAPPEGVVPAPVGVKYTDLAATAGAVQWVKATGTGNTGWRVVSGDSGRRNLASLLQPGVTAPVSLVIQRIGNTVSLTFGGLGRLDAYVPVIYLPAGFQASSFTGFFLARDDYVTGGMSTWCVTGDQMFYLNQVSGGAFTSGSRFGGGVTYQTNDPWPTTIPGTAA